MHLFPRAALVGTLVILAVGCADDAADRTAAPRAPDTTAPVASSLSPTPSSTVAPSSSPGRPQPAGEPGLAWITSGEPFIVAVPLDETGSPSRLRFAPLEDGQAPSLYLAATGGPFDVVATRADYDHAIRAQASIRGRRVELPVDSVTDWSGLDDFLTVHVEDASGATVYDETMSFCPDSGEPIRVSPVGPVDAGETFGCEGGPLTLGMRWTLEEGWAVAVTPTLVENALGPGDYELTVGIAPPYQEVLGAVPPATVAMTVELVDPSEFFEPSDQDHDGIDDSIDDLIDADRDGLDDYGDDPFVDLDGDGFDDRSGLDEGAARSNEESAASAFTDDLIDTMPDPAPDHEGRPGPDAHPSPRAVPDLASLPAFDISTGVDDASRHDVLSFAAITWNRGPAEMVIDGYVRTDEPGLMDAYQQFGPIGRLPGGSAPIGTLEYHAGGGHDHWHFLAFSRYDLLTEAGKEVQRSGKESWCLVNTDPVDLTRPGARSGSALTLSGACGGERSGWIRETLAVGWGDEYIQDVSGQAFDITDLPNGRYVIRLTANPDGTIYEADTTNNVSERLVILGGAPGDRTVDVPPVGLVDTEGASSFDPKD